MVCQWNKPIKIWGTYTSKWNNKAMHSLFYAKDENQYKLIHYKEYTWSMRDPWDGTWRDLNSERIKALDSGTIYLFIYFAAQGMQPVGS